MSIELLIPEEEKIEDRLLALEPALAEQIKLLGASALEGNKDIPCKRQNGHCWSATECAIARHCMG